MISRVSLLYALALGCFFAVLAQAGSYFYDVFGYQCDFAIGGGKVVAVLNLGLPGQFIYTACILFLESLNRPVPGLVIMTGTNILGALLN